MSRTLRSVKSDFSDKSEYDLIAHPGSLFQDGQYKFNFNPSQLDGFIGGLYVLESDDPENNELYGPDNREIDWIRRAEGRTRRDYIILPLAPEEAFERDAVAIARNKTKKHIAIIETENASYVLQYDDVTFIDGLTTAFDLAGLNLEDYIRPIS